MSDVIAYLFRMILSGNFTRILVERFRLPAATVEAFFAHLRAMNYYDHDPRTTRQLFEEFFRALAFNALATLHVTRRAGTNAHHVAEACFKAAARAFRMATGLDPRAGDAVPSTKGAL